MMQRDIRESASGQDVTRLYGAMFCPGEGHVWTAQNPRATPDKSAIYFIGQCFETDLEAGPTSSAWRLDLAGGGMSEVARDARLFEVAPAGDRAVCLGRSGEAADGLQLLSLPYLRLIDEVSISGRVEAAQWSPAGDAVILLVAGAEADLSGAEGGFALRPTAAGPGWLPEVTVPNRDQLWRRLFLWRPGQREPRALTAPPLNVWEAAWLGNDKLLLVASDDHSEASWYGATLRVIDAGSGTELSRHFTRDQIGVPAGAPDGLHHAAIEALCSDRGIICGDVALLDPAGGVRILELEAVEVSDLVWRDPNRLLYAGLRGAETVVGEYDIEAGSCQELWSSERLTISGWYPKIAPYGEDEAIAVLEAYDRPPAIARLGGGEAKAVLNFAPEQRNTIPGRIGHVCWQGRDGLEITGWLLLPEGSPRNLPLLVDVHGGPIAAHRNRYAASHRANPVLVDRGWAVFLPNPRGSGGRGQDFARHVVGDMGGEDAQDILAGIDKLVADGIADPSRIAIFGSSYGGFMSGVMLAHHRRFAAAIPMSPVANWYSQHFASQIPWFDEAFLGSSAKSAGGAHFWRSPVFFLEGVTTPTLVIAGGRDKNTPTSQAVELYNGLVEAGAPAALLIYPEDGHSMRGYPAYLDSAARIVDWLGRHVPASGSKASP